MNSIVYPVGNSLYLNITNRCTNRCAFCIRYKSRSFNQQYPLWLEKEPAAEEILRAVGDPARYEQIVFCGYGEPLIRLDAVKAVAAGLQGTKIRIDTNGHANLFWDKNVLPELEGLIDFMSVSLNAENAEIYDRLCLPFYGKKAYPAVLEFIREAKKHIPAVEATVVDLPAINIGQCREIAEKLGVGFRVRPYYEVNYVR